MRLKDSFILSNSCLGGNIACKGSKCPSPSSGLIGVQVCKIQVL